MSLFETRISRRTFTRSATAATAGLVAGIPTAAVLAQDATPVGTPAEGGLPPLPEGAVVVAEGLWNPRFLAFGDDGTLYITEAGVGGDEVLNPPETGTGELAGATPVAEATPEPAPVSTRGYTGQVSSVPPDGTVTVLASGLASYSDGIGPAGIELGPGEVRFAIGGAGVGSGIEPLPEENTLNRIVLETGAVELIADLGAYEVENNPDGTDVNPNLYQMATAADGRVLVADAGGNTLYAVDPATGEFELLVTLPDRSELPGQPPEIGPGQPVPTGVAVLDDGSPLLGLLSEFWPQGSHSVYALMADGTLAPAGGTLFFNVGIALGPDGNVYASQLFGPPAEGTQDLGPGSVVRVLPENVVEPVIPQVMQPHGMAFDTAGNLYVAINSLMSAPGAPAGMVIRIDGIAAVG